jgi:hypothetical protein
MAEENNENKSWKDRSIEDELERIKTLDIKLKMKKEQDRYEASAKFKTELGRLGVDVDAFFPGAMEYESCGVKFIFSNGGLTRYSPSVRIVQECPKCGKKILSVPITSPAVLAGNLVKFQPEFPHSCIKPVEPQPEPEIKIFKQMSEYGDFVSIAVNEGIVHCLNKYGSVFWFDYTKKMWIKMPVDVAQQ